MLRRMRAIRRSGALLAVLALVFQSLVFAGHVHRPAFAWAAAITADNGAPGVRPDHGPLPERPGDACDICAVLHLAGVAVESAPPVLTAPLFFPRRQSAISPPHRSSPPAGISSPNPAPLRRSEIAARPLPDALPFDRKRRHTASRACWFAQPGGQWSQICRDIRSFCGW